MNLQRVSHTMSQPNILSSIVSQSNSITSQREEHPPKKVNPAQTVVNTTTDISLGPEPKHSEPKHFEPPKPQSHGLPTRITKLLSQLMKPLSLHRKRIIILLLLHTPIPLHSITITQLPITALLRKVATAALMVMAPLDQVEAPIMADSDKH
jgi:hypothetical protein